MYGSVTLSGITEDRKQLNANLGKVLVPNWTILKNFNLFLAALGLPCCTQAFSSCGEGGLLFASVCGLLIAVASLVAELGL